MNNQKDKEMFDRKTIIEIQNHIFEINRDLKHLSSGNVSHNKPSIIYHVNEIDKIIKKINRERIKKVQANKYIK